MARPRQRVCLDDGLKLDANKLVRDTFWPTGSDPLVFSTQWTSSRDGVIASANMVLQQHGEDRAVLRIFFRGKFKQRIELVAQPRHFGGNQWYFKCPATGRKCSVVWQPPGTSRFCSRQAWGKQVAYSTQFQTPFVRAVMAREKVKDRLIGDLNPPSMGLAAQGEVDADEDL
jgi:hypothetical protein